MEALIGDKVGDELLRGWKLLWMLGMSLLILEAGKGWWLGPELAGGVGFGLLCVRVEKEGSTQEVRVASFRCRPGCGITLQILGLSRLSL